MDATFITIRVYRTDLMEAQKSVPYKCDNHVLFHQLVKNFKGEEKPVAIGSEKVETKVEKK